METARQSWLAAHPHLGPIARFHAILEEAAAGGGARPPAPGWEPTAEDLAHGVPLVHRASGASRAALSSATAAELEALVDRLCAAPLPAGIAAACRELRDALRAPGAWAGAVDWVFDGAAPASAPLHPGLLRLFGWTSARRVLGPATAASALRREPLWDHGHCPTCGSLPAMAQLVVSDEARARLLACGLCATAWRFRRVGCPFCGNDAPERLSVFEIEEEPRLRIDACDACGGYVKTYAGEGDEELFLADWPTLHLDLAAEARGLRRVGASLYELPEGERRADP